MYIFATAFVGKSIGSHKRVMNKDQLSIQPDIADTQQEINRLFPVFLKLEELDVLLVGAGKVGFEKLNALLNNAPGAAITVVASHISDTVRSMTDNYTNVSLVERPFEPADLDNKQIAVIAVDDKSVSNYIRVLAKEKNVLVNVADTPEQCDFYLGSIVQKGNLKIAISTNGKSPTIAKRMKEQLNDLIPDEIEGVIQNMHTIRQDLKGDFAVASISIDQSSGSTAHISGRAQSLSVQTSSGAGFYGFDLASDKCNADASSGGNIHITVNKELSADASSGGGIRYKGDGVITKISTSSGGSVKKNG